MPNPFMGSMSTTFSAAFTKTTATLLRKRRGRKPATFLREQLQAGPREVEELLHAALERGVTKRTLERAKKVLGVKATRQGFGAGGGWFWKLP